MLIKFLNRKYKFKEVRWWLYRVMSITLCDLVVVNLCIVEIRKDREKWDKWVHIFAKTKTQLDHQKDPHAAEVKTV